MSLTRRILVVLFGLFILAAPTVFTGCVVGHDHDHGDWHHDDHDHYHDWH